MLRDTPSDPSNDRVTCGFVVDRLVARRRVRAEGCPLADVDTATSQDRGVHAEQGSLWPGPIGYQRIRVVDLDATAAGDPAAAPREIMTSMTTLGYRFRNVVRRSRRQGGGCRELRCRELDTRHVPGAQNVSGVEFTTSIDGARLRVGAQAGPAPLGAALVGGLEDSSAVNPGCAPRRSGVAGSTSTSRWRRAQAKNRRSTQVCWWWLRGESQEVFRVPGADLGHPVGAEQALRRIRTPHVQTRLTKVRPRLISCSNEAERPVLELTVTPTSNNVAEICAEIDDHGVISRIPGGEPRNLRCNDS